MLRSELDPPDDRTAAYWSERWRRLVDERRVQVERLQGQGPQTNYWDKRAGQFHRMTGTQAADQDPLVVLLKELVKGGSALDVGAGVGRYTVPLASAADRVTAVEPSEGMRSFLVASIADRRLTNVTVVPSTWEDSVVEPHDVVIASHILYPIADVVPFVQKLDAHARQHCIISIRVDQIGAGIEQLWNEVWREPRAPEPTFLDLYYLLFALGIRANVRLAPFNSSSRPTTFEEAVEQVRGFLFMPDDHHEHDQVIRDAVPRIFDRSGDGWTWRQQRQVALVWWTKI